MKFPNLLESKAGRFTTFFFLYITEGLPQGFAKMALVWEMNRVGMSGGETAKFTAVVFLPWAWKWAIGPAVDVFHSDKLGRRRAWILAAQVMMIASLLLCMPVDFSTHLKLFTMLLVIHNIFAATQDVAIDALACETLKEDERGLANGLMFAGAHTGYLIGGAGSLALMKAAGFEAALLVLCATILTVTLSVTVWIKEPKRGEKELDDSVPALTRFNAEIVQYVRDVFKAIFSRRAAFVGLLFALLPHGVIALDVPIRVSLGKTLGFDETSMGNLEIIAGLVWIGGCIVGGYLSDYCGRRKAFAVFVIGSCLPAIWLAWHLTHNGWDVPENQIPVDPPVMLASIFWWACIIYSIFTGLIFGTRTALFMDITTPAVAATQFTAYMALMNLATSAVNWFEGLTLDEWQWSYPKLILFECVAGSVCLLLLPLMTVAKSEKNGEQTE
jgi:PAT family beta-lactamase induction signal transducer AmpG